ncbi:MAG: iron-sulfur cluster assembly scaffold protein, partial [Propionibacteriaceae bacterium]|nr:iron-sulfur cluster assembly scaffold protein [Propionibacteriaceae bacterium]
HQVKGCALCQASAAVLSEEAVGKPVAEVAAAEESLTEMIARDGPAPAGWPRLGMFEPVRGVKNRHQCVLLPFRAARNAIESVMRKKG